jgi:hypothetical protein
MEPNLYITTDNEINIVIKHVERVIGIQLGWIKIFIVLEQCWKDGLINDDEYVDLLCNLENEEFELKDEFMQHIINLILAGEPLVEMQKINNEVYKLDENLLAVSLQEDPSIDSFIKLIRKEESLKTEPKLKDGNIELKLYENFELDEEPDYDGIIKSINERSKGNWIYEYDNLKQQWKDGLITKNEFENRAGDLGVPDRESLWKLKGFRRIYECSKSNKKTSEKTIIRIYPQMQIMQRIKD